MSSNGSCTSSPTAETMIWSPTESVETQPSDMTELFNFDGMHATSPRPLKRKYTDLLEEEKGWSCGELGCSSKDNCVHTSETKEVEDDAAPVPDTSPSKAKQAKVECSRIVYLGGRTMTVEQAMDILLKAEMAENGSPHYGLGWWDGGGTHPWKV
jgi:hypothetical protein